MNLKINESHEILDVLGQKRKSEEDFYLAYEYMYQCPIYMKLAELTNKCHMAAHFPEFNLDSSIIDAIILTNLICLASMLEMPTLNTK
jgi:hypothetical protein